MPDTSLESTLDFFFASRRRHTRLQGDWSSDVCSSDLGRRLPVGHHDERGVAGRGVRAVDARVRTGQHQGDARRRQGDARSEERRVGKEREAAWEANEEKTKVNGEAIKPDRIKLH